MINTAIFIRPPFLPNVVGKTKREGYKYSSERDCHAVRLALLRKEGLDPLTRLAEFRRQRLHLRLCFRNAP